MFDGRRVVPGAGHEPTKPGWFLQEGEGGRCAANISSEHPGMSLAPEAAPWKAAAGAQAWSWSPTSLFARAQFAQQ